MKTAKTETTASKLPAPPRKPPAWSIVGVAAYVLFGLAAPLWLNGTVLPQATGVRTTPIQHPMWLIGVVVAASLSAGLCLSMKREQTPRFRPGIAILAVLLGVVAPAMVLGAGIGIQLFFFGLLSGVLWLTAAPLGWRLLRDFVFTAR